MNETYNKYLLSVQWMFGFKKREAYEYIKATIKHNEIALLDSITNCFKNNSKNCFKED